MAVAGGQQDEAEFQEHARTFAGFVGVTIWSTAITSIAILFFTLVFAVGTPWPGALVISVGAGVLTGVILSRSGAWYGAMIGLFALGMIGGGVFEIVRRFVA
ncbi:MAG: aa3-type cytochrome c oxidase subunit IV [Caulobacterales bacterium]|nr:aa3-type cytochrome c oxidase subunit IV [Caulobacterales bacterium]